MSLNDTTIFAVGGSRNIGYLSSVRLLGQIFPPFFLAVRGSLTCWSLGHGATVVFLLRNPKAFDEDATMKPYLDSGKAILVRGDALNATDVANAWKKVAEVTGRVDFVVFSVGM